MLARAFWKAVTVDRPNLLERFFSLLNERKARFYLIDDQALNAHVEPVASLDLDVVIAADQLPEVESLVKDEFELVPFADRLNISARRSDLRIQLQLNP